jgi:hypothetical protein
MAPNLKEGFVLSPMTTWGNSKVYYTVYTRENMAIIKVVPIGMVSQM